MQRALGCNAHNKNQGHPLTANTLGISIFAFYLVAIIIIGVVASRYQKTEADFWVAGRRFGLGVMIMANMAARSG